MRNEGHPIDLPLALDFILAGKAFFTIRNTQTGNRYTYRVTIPRENNKETSRMFWVSVLTGSDNNSSYSYIGTIKPIGPVVNNQPLWMFTHGAKSKLLATAPSVEGFRLLFNNLFNRRQSDARLEFWHEGKCCRCGRRLTDPQSISNGIGPECAGIKHNHNHNH